MQVSARLPAVGKGAGGPPPPPPALFPRPSPPGRRSRPGFGGQNFPERPSFAAPRRPAARSSQQRGGPRGGAAAPGSGALRSAGDRAVLGPSGRPRVRWGAGSAEGSAVPRPRPRTKLGRWALGARLPAASERGWAPGARSRPPAGRRGLARPPPAARAFAAPRPQGRAAGEGARRAPGPVRAPRCFLLTFPGLVGPAGLLC